jgi:hypothetical protein
MWKEFDDGLEVFFSAFWGAWESDDDGFIADTGHWTRHDGDCSAELVTVRAEGLKKYGR